MVTGIGRLVVELFSILYNFPFVPPLVRFAPPVTEHVPLHSKSLCKNMARATGGANNMRPLCREGTIGKDP